MQCRGKLVAHPNDDSVIYKRPTSTKHIVSPTSDAPVSGKAVAEYVQEALGNGGGGSGEPREYTACGVFVNVNSLLWNYSKVFVAGNVVHVMLDFWASESCDFAGDAIITRPRR
jgi:hypothetical protein